MACVLPTAYIIYALLTTYNAIFYEYRIIHIVDLYLTIFSSGFALGLITTIVYYATAKSIRGMSEPTDFVAPLGFLSLIISFPLSLRHGLISALPSIAGGALTAYGVMKLHRRIDCALYSVVLLNALSAFLRGLFCLKFSRFFITLLDALGLALDVWLWAFTTLSIAVGVFAIFSAFALDKKFGIERLALIVLILDMICTSIASFILLKALVVLTPHEAGIYALEFDILRDIIALVVMTFMPLVSAEIFAI